jgi:hypothetical protein
VEKELDEFCDEPGRPIIKNQANKKRSGKCWSIPRIRIIEYLIHVLNQTFQKYEKKVL